MRRFVAISVTLLIALGLFLVQPGGHQSHAQVGSPVAGSPTPSAFTLVASGLTNPREFTWNSLGAMFVGLAGNGGSTPGAPVAPPPLGPLMGGPSASVVKIADGCPVTLAGNLPSSLDATSGSVGVGAVAIVGDQLYALIEGGTPQQGNPNTTNGVVRINSDGSTTLVADYTAWLQSNPPKNPPPEGFPNVGNPFSMIAAGDKLYVVDSINGLITTVDPNTGAITLFAAISASHGHVVPTGLAAAPDGSFYVGTLTTVPYPNGAAKVIRIAADGTVSDVWTGLTMVTGVAVGPDGALYAAEMATGNTQQPPFIKPGTGQIVRQTGPNTAEPVVTGLNFPISIGFGPDGRLYFGQPAQGANNGEGEILSVPATGGPFNASGLSFTSPCAVTATPVASPVVAPPVASPGASPVASPVS